MRRRAQRAIMLVVGLAAGYAAAPFALADSTQENQIALDVTQMRMAAELNLHNGDTARALAFANALLQRDPMDITALLIRAHALRARGEYTTAQTTARTAWRAAQSDNHKFAAAMLMAQSLSSQGKRTRAQLWLRRAAQIAPSERHAARAARDFKYVRRQNQWRTHLSFTLAPNSNINNGSSRDSSSLLYQLTNPFNIDGAGEIALGAASQALSGIETGVQVQSRYRFHQTERTAHDLRLGLSYRTYHLSSSSKDDLAADDAARVARGEEANNLTGSDFAYGTLELGYGYKQLRADKRGEFSLSADLGQSFYGGERYNRYLRARVGQTYYANQTTKYDFGAAAEKRRSEGGSDQHVMSLSAGMSRALANGDGLYLGVAVTSTRADLERLEYDELRLRSGYVLGRDVMGTRLQFGISTSFRDYDVSPHDPSGRREFQVAAEVTATFKQIDYYGFNPTVSLSASTTDSNIGLYDVNRVGLSIGIASSF
ncbi:surface lipoprotein assembly modifier [uncultured Sulfitobacter sp.]|uniref:surface lipoprotein assembly modifier n=1 Tax=uncultured Sulfitobacter sp. TaxID=191468 RepID=UPI002631D500|nr:surface lipoprotein assembly modifier [uncultured Sulfitobacter sp.]